MKLRIFSWHPSATDILNKYFTKYNVEVIDREIVLDYPSEAVGTFRDIFILILELNKLGLDIMLSKNYSEDHTIFADTGLFRTR